MKKMISGEQSGKTWEVWRAEALQEYSGIVGFADERRAFRSIAKENIPRGGLRKGDPSPLRRGVAA